MTSTKTIVLSLLFYFTFLFTFGQNNNSAGAELQNTLLVNLNKIDLPYDSLFSLKFGYERYGEISDSLLVVRIFQVALDSDSINEKLIYSKNVSFKKNLDFEYKIIYQGYEDITHSFSASNLSLIDRTAIIPLHRITEQSGLKKQEAKNAFVFVGSIFEEGTQVRLPNVRVIIKDKFNPEKQFVEITDAYGSFKDSVFGYELNERLRFDIYLKKEGYISKSFLFEEVLTEYGTVDLEEYLKKIKLTKAEVGVEIGKAANLYPIYFDLDKSDIRRDAAKELDKVVEIMNELPNISIELSSHTDSRATDRYNLALSQRRANSTQNYLIRKGISPARIESVGYGEKRLANNCANEVPCTEEEHSKNRRTEFKIVDMTEVKGNSNKKSEAIADNNSSKVQANKQRSNSRNMIFSGKAIPFVEVVATNVLNRKELYTAKADKNGNFSIETRDYNLGDKLYIDFLLSRTGYISKTFNYRKRIASLLDPINLNEEFDNLKLIEIDLNIDIGTAANMAPILFELDKAIVTKEAEKELYQIAAILLEQPGLGIELGSHTDSRGDDTYNLKLSQERANATMNYLVSQGISYSRIKAIGYGEKKPLNKCVNGVDCSEAEHAKNRRTEFIITKLR